MKNNTDLVLVNTDLMKNNTDLVLTKTDSMKNNTDLVLVNTDLMKNNTDLVLAKTDLMLQTKHNAVIASAAKQSVKSQAQTTIESLRSTLKIASLRSQ